MSPPIPSYGLTLSSSSFTTNAVRWNHQPIVWTDVDNPYNAITFNEWAWASGSQLMCPAAGWYTYTVWLPYTEGSPTFNIGINVNGEWMFSGNASGLGLTGITGLRSGNSLSGVAFFDTGDLVSFSVCSSAMSDTLGVSATSRFYLQIQNLQGFQGSGVGATGVQGSTGFQGLQGAVAPPSPTYGLTLSSTSYTTNAVANTPQPITWSTVANPYSTTTLNEWNWVSGNALTCPASGWYAYNVWLPYTSTVGVNTFYMDVNGQRTYGSSNEKVKYVGNTGDASANSFAGLAYLDVGDSVSFGIVSDQVSSSIDISISNPLYLQIQSVLGGASFASSQGVQGTEGVQGLQGVQGLRGTQGAGGALGYYGSFEDTTDQVITSITDAYIINIGSTIEANGVSIVDGTKLTFEFEGTYNVQYSIQFDNVDTNEQHDAEVWFRKNGVDLPNSGSIFGVPRTHSGINGHAIGAINYVITLNAGDYLELVWRADDTDVSIQSSPGATDPVRPGVPGVILTATQVMYTQTGAQGPTGPLPTYGNSIAIGANAGSTTQSDFAIAIGSSAGSQFQGSYTVSIGADAGHLFQSESAVAIGRFAGYTGQGSYAIAIGQNAGYDSQASYSICLNATSVAVNPGTTGLFVAPIRYSSTSYTTLTYDVSTNEIVRGVSSLRYKTAVEDIDPAYSSKIYKLRPVYYRSLAPSDDPTWSFYGLIAEEVASVEPRVVVFTGVDNDIPESIQYERLIPLMIKEMQILREELSTLQTEVRQLREGGSTSSPSAPR